MSKYIKPIEDLICAVCHLEGSHIHCVTAWQRNVPGEEYTVTVSIALAE